MEKLSKGLSFCLWRVFVFVPELVGGKLLHYSGYISHFNSYIHPLGTFIFHDCHDKRGKKQMPTWLVHFTNFHIKCFCAVEVLCGGGGKVQYISYKDISSAQL